MKTAFAFNLAFALYCSAAHAQTPSPDPIQQQQAQVALKAQRMYEVTGLLDGYLEQDRINVHDCGWTTGTTDRNVFVKACAPELAALLGDCDKFLETKNSPLCVARVKQAINHGVEE